MPVRLDESERDGVSQPEECSPAPRPIPIRIRIFVSHLCEGVRVFVYDEGLDRQR